MLGAILLHNEHFGLVSAVLSPADFYRDAHRCLFDTMGTLAARGDAIDLVTLREELGRSRGLDDVGGPAYIAALVDGMPRQLHVADYAAIVRNCAAARDVGAACRHTLKRLSEDTQALANGLPAALIARVDAARARVVSGGSPNETIYMAASLPEILSRLAEGRPLRTPVLGEVLALGELAMFHGQPRDGKSWAALEVAGAVALGDRAFGLERLRAPVARAVIIMGNEDQELTVAQRIRLILAGRDVYEPPTNIHLLVGRGYNLDNPSHQAALIAEARRLEAGLIVLDPLRSLTACVDQGPHELQPFALFLRRLLRETGAAVLSVHHDAKPQAGINDARRRAQRASGGAIFSVMDAPLHVERIDDRRSLVAPDGFKFCPDPQSFVFSLTGGPDEGRVTMVAEDVAAGETNQYALQERLLAALAEHGGTATSRLATMVRARKEDVRRALEQLVTAGKIDHVKAGNANRWFPKGAQS